MSATATQEEKEEKRTPALADFGRGLREYQKQVLHFQKSAFDSTDMIDRTEGVPDEGRELVNEWVETFRRGREDYKAAVDRTYDLMVQYFERIDSPTEQESGV